MLDDLLIKPFIATILVTLSCSQLGVFVLWKRMVYFGDSLSHSILLGSIAGILFPSWQILILITFSILFSLFISTILENRFFAKEVVIAVISYLCIALAVLINDIWIKTIGFGNYIFGDIITVGNEEIIILAIVTIIISIFCFMVFKKFLLIAISSDLATADGIKIRTLDLLFLILLSLVIAISIKITGILLMTALMVLPAAIARIFSTSAKQMILFSIAIGLCMSTLSFRIADNYNLTISSVIVATLSLIFVISLLIKTKIQT